MADDNKQKVEGGPEENEDQSSGKPKFNLIKVGVPLFVVQVVIAFLLANYVIVPLIFGSASSVKKISAEQAGDEKNGEKETRPEFGKIFTVEDVIANPADSKGMQFVLINLGFEVKDDADVETMKAREVQIRDILINILSAKMLSELDGADDKENLRVQIKEAIKNILPEGHLLNVYFSNYIIQ